MKNEISHDTLNAELEQLDAEAARLREGRSYDALDCLRGDKAAQKRLADIDTSLAQIAARRLTVEDGLNALDRQLRATLDAAERQRRLEKADRIEAAIETRACANAALDDALGTFAGALKEWLDADQAMNRAGVIERGWRPYQALSAAIYHHLDAGLGTDAMNFYSRMLLDVFPRNSMGANHWRPVSRDIAIESARSQVAELRR